MRRETAAEATRRVRFTLDGRSFEGIEGESIARALFRQGERTLSRSVKYYRPRGISCGRGRCVSCLVEVDGVPGVRACLTPVGGGMSIRRQDFRPFFAPLLTAAVRLLPFPAGFYFRFFTRPTFVRRSFLGALRRMAGVGRIVATPSRLTPAPQGNSPLPRIEPTYDTIVIGAGLSGMQAAVSASETGARVLLVDEYPAPGGHRRGPLADPAEAAARDGLVAALSASSVTRAHGCTAQGFYAPGAILVGATTTRPGYAATTEHVTAASFVFATGAGDALPLFENNDLPGVFGSRALRLFLERDQLVPGRHAILYGDELSVGETLPLLGAHDIGLAAILYLENGPDVEGVIVHRHARLLKAVGGSWVSSVRFRTGQGDLHEVACDIACVALCGQPTFDLPYQAGFRFAFSGPPATGREDDRVMTPTETEMRSSSARCFLTGETAGIFNWRKKLEHAASVGRRAASKE